MKPGCLLLLALLSIGPLQNTHAQEPAISDSLTNVLVAKEKDMFAIVMGGDRPAAENLFAPDYITINADGVMQTKEMIMADTARKNMFAGVTFKLFDRKVRVYGDIAIINGRSQYLMGDKVLAEVYHTEIWLKEKGKWIANQLLRSVSFRVQALPREIRAAAREPKNVVLSILRKPSRETPLRYLCNCVILDE